MAGSSSKKLKAPIKAPVRAGAKRPAQKTDSRAPSPQAALPQGPRSGKAAKGPAPKGVQAGKPAKGQETQTGPINSLKKMLGIGGAPGKAPAPAPVKGAKSASMGKPGLP